mmetsp:Transcript_50320/g.93034  ORF Transcript_50320/g.93034 Transcript_50320/m.93034 type:complete len:100 (-) Transcript_50320:515-814(-)
MICASQWRVRENKRKRARDEDKAKLAQLQEYVTYLEQKVAAWDAWYHGNQCKDQDQVDTLLQALAGYEREELSERVCLRDYGGKRSSSSSHWSGIFRPT